MYFLFELIERALAVSDEFKDTQHNLVIFGSVLNALYDKNNSDLDLTVIVEQNPQLNHKKVLDKVLDALLRSQVF